MSNPLDRIITERAEDNGAYAIAYALLRVADQIRKLGLNDAATSMGAVELLASEVAKIGPALSHLAEVVEAQQ